MFAATTDDLAIVVDHRERSKVLVDRLSDSGLFEVRVGSLEIGDIQINQLVIERKTIEDLCRSLEDGRLMRQMVAMRRVARARLLLVEGNRAKIPPQYQHAVRNTLNSVAIRLQTPVIHTVDEADSARVISKAAMWQYRLGGTPGSLRFRKPAEDDAFRLKYVLLGFPRIGPDRAKAPLDHFKTLRRVLAASEAELREVPGIGPGLARELARLLDVSAVGM